MVLKAGANTSSRVVLSLDLWGVNKRAIPDRRVTSAFSYNLDLTLYLDKDTILTSTTTLVRFYRTLNTVDLITNLSIHLQPYFFLEVVIPAMQAFTSYTRLA